jgi:hypothetical protein
MMGNKRWQIKTFCGSLLLLGAAHSGSVLAQCALASGISFVTIEPAQGRQVLVDSTLPAGTPLGRQGQVTEIPRTFNCTAASNIITLNNVLISAPNNGVFELTVGGQPSGVGIRLLVADSNGQLRQFPYQETVTVPRGAYTAPNRLATSLEKVGATVIYGQTDIVQFANYAASNLYNGAGPIGAPVPFRRIGIQRFNLTRPSCFMDVKSLNQTVPLGRHRVSEFDNATPSAWVPFNLTVANCSDPAVLADITFGTTADADASNNNLFSMNQGGPRGLGIAIATAGTASTAMLPGQTQTFPAVLSGQSFPFQARLQPTTGQVTAGAINRPLTVTVNFR